MRWTTIGVATLLCAASGCEDAATTSAPGGGKKGETALAPPVDDEFQSSLSAEDQGRIVARIGDLEITLKEFERRLQQQAPYARARYASLERKKEFLDNLVRFEVLAAEAARKGYDRDPDVIQQMKQTMVRKLMTREVNELVKLSDISEEAMQKYYEQESATYHKPEQVRVSHILVGDEGRAKKLHAELTRAVEADRQSYRKVFSDFARQHSEDVESKPRGGDLRFFSRTEEGGDQPKEMADAAFALEKVGDVSKPVKGPAGWHILLLTGRKNRYDRTYDQVKRQIQNRLYRRDKRDATDKYVNDLKVKARVTVQEDLLDKVVVAPEAEADAGQALVGRPPGSLLGPVDPAAPPTGSAPAALVAPPPPSGFPGAVVPPPAPPDHAEPEDGH